MATAQTRVHNLLDAPAGVADPEVGRWLAGWTEIRRATNALLDDIPPDAIDADLGDGGDTLGTVLFHVADAEVWWIHRVLEGRPLDDAIQALLTYQGRDGDDPLTHVTGESMAKHRRRLDDVRASVLAVLAPLSNEEFNRVRVLADQDVSASWMVFHLIDHEWDHTVRIREIRDAFRREPGKPASM